VNEVATVGARYRGWLARPRPAVLTALRRSLRQVHDRYRHSLQVRVVSATLVLSAVVLSVLGYILMQHLVARTYTNMEQTSQAIAEAGLANAQGRATTDGGLVALSQTPGASSSKDMYLLAQDLKSTGGPPYAVLVAPLRQYEAATYSSGDEVDFAGIPKLPIRLTNAINAEWQSRVSVALRPHQEWASMAIGGNPRSVPGLLIGAPFGGGYALYYFFPLATAQRTITSIQQSLLVAGIAVVFLLAAIAWLVTRWVVVPVRQAVQGAKRLSAGELNQRMEVRGSDELAALANSFNEMAASLQEKLQELEELSQVQRQFVSDVSHELRTPLTTIRIASDVLYASRSELDQAAARSAELMQSQLERFESLLTDLLEISRYDANAATLDAEPVDVCTIVLQSADIAQHMAERRGTKIEFRVPAMPCIAEVDRRRVERILRNLLLNAVEHGEDKDTVVTVATDSAAVAVSVRDFGVGLKPGEEQLVFDRFWRADPARARTSGGTGLGLAIALEDARLHGGWLEAWGEPGEGSVFRLTLPRSVGGELHGSPLPLNPLPLSTADEGIDAGVLMAAVVADLADDGAAAPDPADRAAGPASGGHEARSSGAQSSGTASSGAVPSGAGPAASEVAARG
jgi:two-component system, OmpR family, sensor histidine kinase MtrB